MRYYKIKIEDIATREVDSYYFESVYTEEKVKKAFDKVVDKYDSFETPYIREKISNEIFNISLLQAIQEPQYYTSFHKDYGYKYNDIMITITPINIKNPTPEDDRFSKEVNDWCTEYVRGSCGGVNTFYAYSDYHFDKIPIQLLIDIQKEYGCNYFSVHSDKDGDIIRMWKEIK